MPVQVGRTGEENNGILRVDRVYMLTNFKNKYIGDRAFYKRYMYLALPMILQNAITNLVSFLDNIMVGQLGTEQMSGVAIVNQLIFVYNLAIFGAVSAASIFGDLGELLIIPCCHYTISPKYPDLIIRFLFS